MPYGVVVGQTFTVTLPSAASPMYDAPKAPPPGVAYDAPTAPPPAQVRGSLPHPAPLRRLVPSRETVLVEEQ